MVRDDPHMVHLPQPRAEEWEWQLRGACRSMPIGMFFPSTNLRGHELAAVERNAKLICKQCPVVERCLQYSLECREKYGIWGGFTSAERRKLAPRSEPVTAWSRAIAS